MRTQGEYRVIAYLRVSTAEQAESGAGLDAQRAQIESAVVYRGWHLTTVLEDAGASGKSLTGRPALRQALEMLARGEADALVVAKLDRLSRSLLDFASLMETARREDWNLVALDLGIDLSTPAGEFMSNVMASAAQWERRIIGQRTKDALAVRRAAGVRLGRPQTLSVDVVCRVVNERQGGVSLQGIADGLMSDGVTTARGGSRWYASTIRAVLRSQTAASIRTGLEEVVTGGPHR